MKIEYCGLTDIGKVRKINQDSILMCSNKIGGLFVVADGMGGHSAGERASFIITQNLESWWKSMEMHFREKDFEELIQSVINCLQRANYDIYSRYNNVQICGSTVVALLICGKKYCCITCGDSRIYQLKWWKLKQLSVDDVWESRQEIQQNYTIEQIKKHPNYGKLLTAVGIGKELKARVTIGRVYRNQKFLLCSDGLYKMVFTKDVKQALKTFRNSTQGKKVLDNLCKKVYQGGGNDNCSIILVRCF